jgi:hypothetical protein
MIILLLFRFVYCTLSIAAALLLLLSSAVAAVTATVQCIFDGQKLLNNHYYKVGDWGAFLFGQRVGFLFSF